MSDGSGNTVDTCAIVADCVTTTSTLVDNGNGTYTYTAEDGTVSIIDTCEPDQVDRVSEGLYRVTLEDGSVAEMNMLTGKCFYLSRTHCHEDDCVAGNCDCTCEACMFSMRDRVAKNRVIVDKECVIPLGSTITCNPATTWRLSLYDPPRMPGH